jgi:hypothetical protein
VIHVNVKLSTSNNRIALLRMELEFLPFSAPSSLRMSSGSIAFKTFGLGLATLTLSHGLVLIIPSLISQMRKPRSRCSNERQLFDLLFYLHEDCYYPSDEVPVRYVLGRL